MSEKAIAVAAYTNINEDEYYAACLSFSVQQEKSIENDRAQVSAALILTVWSTFANSSAGRMRRTRDTLHSECNKTAECAAVKQEREPKLE